MRPSRPPRNGQKAKSRKEALLGPPGECGGAGAEGPGGVGGGLAPRPGKARKRNFAHAPQRGPGGAPACAKCGALSRRRGAWGRGPMPPRSPGRGARWDGFRPPFGRTPGPRGPDLEAPKGGALGRGADLEAHSYPPMALRKWARPGPSRSQVARSSRVVRVLVSCSG